MLFLLIFLRESVKILVKWIYIQNLFGIRGEIYIQHTIKNKTKIVLQIIVLGKISKHIVKKNVYILNKNIDECNINQRN